jgi:hypothetical protein
MSKLQKVADALQKASQVPPEVALIEQLLSTDDEAAQVQLLREHKEKVTPEFTNALSTIATQMQNGDDPEMARRLRALNRLVMRFSMENQIRQ